MPKLAFILLAAAGAAAAAASPASAQYYGRPGYGYANQFGGSDYERRLFNIRNSLGSVSPDQAYRLDSEARMLERQLQQAYRNGIGPNETHYFDARVYDLEIRLGQAVNRVRYGYGANNGYNGYYGDRSRGRHWERDEDDDRD
jgi:hypothetical protein